MNNSHTSSGLLLKCIVVSGIMMKAQGCAVMTIDVDVYKGPLANHEDVQLQQLAVMAIAAKPILIELRDRLQWEPLYESKKDYAGANDLEDFIRIMRVRAKSHNWYKTGFVPPTNKTNETQNNSDEKEVKSQPALNLYGKHPMHEWKEENPYFDNAEAARVNDILGLYEDIRSRRITQLLTTLREQITQYKREIGAFSGSDDTWNTLIKSLSTPTDLENRLKPSEIAELTGIGTNVLTEKKTELESARTELDKIRSMLTVLKNQHTTQKNTIDANTKSLIDLTNNLIPLRNMDLETKKAAAEKRLKELERQIKKNNNPDKDDAALRKKQIDSLEKDIKRFDELLSSLKTARDGISTLKQAIETLKDNFTETKAKLKTAETKEKEKKDAFTSLSKSVRDLKEKNAKARRKIIVALKTYANLSIGDSLASAYGRFLKAENGVRDWSAIPKAHNNLVAELNLIAPGQKLFVAFQKSEKGEDFSATRVLNDLRTGGFVDLHARLLFGLEDGADLTGEIFTKRVNKLTEEYRDSRKKLEDILISLLDLGVALELGAVQLKDIDRINAIGITANLISEIVQPQRLLASAFGQTDKKELNYLRQIFEFNGTFKAQYLNTPNRKWNRNDYEFVSKFIADALSNDIGRMSAAIRLAHNEFKKPGIQLKFGMQQPQRWHLAFNDSMSRKYGVVRSPTPKIDLDLRNDILGKIELFNQYLSPEGLKGFASLRGGRLSQGMETIIENFLKSRYPLSKLDDSAKDLNRDMLLGALVRFAQKLLFLANNHGLIKPPKENGIVKKIGAGSLRWIGGSGVEDIKHFGKHLKLHGMNSASYVRVLQAVGNSILVQADELTHRWKHSDKVKGKIRFEKEVRNGVFRNSRFGFLPETPKNTSPSSIDVLDQTIALLRYQYLVAVKEEVGGKQSAKARRLAEAIKAAYDHRSGMVYIRPPAAYLRSSYPTATLQGNPNLRWDNKLGGHAMRSIPFGPQIRDIFNPLDKRDAGVTAEIDKQFWQNINRVRVAGGGDTNYVIAKDDIGNWYVKGYSANPKDVIKSTKNLALFGLGAKMDADLLGRARRREAENGGDGGAVKAEPTAMHRVFNRYEEEYESRTKEHYDELRKRLTGDTPVLQSDIQKEWESVGLSDAKQMKTLVDLLEASTKTYIKGQAAKSMQAVPRKPTTGETDIQKKRREAREEARGTNIIAAANALRRYYRDLIAKIKNEKLTASAEAKHQSAASKRDATKQKLEEEKANLKRLNDKMAILEKKVTESEGEEKKKVETDIGLLNAEINTQTSTIESLKRELKTKEDRVADLKKAWDDQISNEKQILNSTNRIIRGLLIDILKKRQQTVQEYERAVLFIGKAGSPEDN